MFKAQESQLEVLQEYESMIEGYQSSKLDLNRESKFGRRGGKRWPLWVTQVCCELLIHGSPPSSVPSNIGLLMATLYGEEPKKLPSLNYVRQCQVLIQIIGETITAMKLAACPKWGEIFFDATTRRQVPFSAVVISLIGNTPESVDPIIVSSCVVMEDETSEMQVEGVVAKVNSLKNRLQRLLEVVQCNYPDLIGTLPSPDGINIQKLGDNGLIMTDSCNAAQKARRLMQHMIQGTLWPLTAITICKMSG